MKDKTEAHSGVCPNCGHCPTCGRSNQPVQVWPRPYPYPYPYYWQTPRVYCGTSGFINTTAAQPVATNSIQMVTT